MKRILEQIIDRNTEGNYLLSSSDKAQMISKILDLLGVIGAVSGSDLVKSDWNLRECFKQLRFDKNHHLGLGDIRLTIAQQEEICDLVERFYHCR